MLQLKNRNDSVIGILASFAVITAGTIAFITYVNSKEHRKLEKRNAELENEIKQLELLKLKHDLDGIA